MSNVSKIRVCREIILLDKLLLHDRPIQLSSAQIDYLLKAGFTGRIERFGKFDRNTFYFSDSHLEIKYVILEEVANGED